MKALARENHWNLGMKCLSVQYSHSVVSDSAPQHARPPCPSPTPGVHINPCPLSRWCHPTILSSVVPFFSCPQSFPASGSFQMSQFFASVASNPITSWQIDGETMIDFIFLGYKMTADGDCSHEIKRPLLLAKVLEFQLQHQSFQWTPRTDLLQDGLVGSPCNPRDS